MITYDPLLSLWPALLPVIVLPELISSGSSSQQQTKSLLLGAYSDTMDSLFKWATTGSHLNTNRSTVVAVVAVVVVVYCGQLDMERKI